MFRSYDSDELLTTTWTIVNIATGDTIESVLDGTEPTVTFIDDSDVSTRKARSRSAWGSGEGTSTASGR